MSTRSNIIIQTGSTKIYIYRHCDGYLSATGVDIYERALTAKTADDFLRSILSATYEATQYSPAKPIYELTSEIHGDIEHAYVIEFEPFASPFEKTQPRIGHAEMNWDDDSDNAVSAIKLGSLAAFRAKLNADIRKTNKRYAELRSKKGYEKLTDLPELA